MPLEWTAVLVVCRAWLAYASHVSMCAHMLEACPTRRLREVAVLGEGEQRMMETASLCRWTQLAPSESALKLQSAGDKVIDTMALAAWFDILNYHPYGYNY